MRYTRTRELTGQRFGRLRVIGLLRTDKKLGRIWMCLCDCGTECNKTSGRLGDKHIKDVSCGCAKRDSIRKASAAAWKVTTKFSHPLKPKLKGLYRNMLDRCYNPKNKRYSDYGGRGISVCDEWRNDRYEFYRWCIANGCESALQIDRKDNDGPYSPENCQWADGIQQANNTRKNRYLIWNGERWTVSQWARLLGVEPRALQHRVSRGWSTVEIFTTPFRCQS